MRLFQLRFALFCSWLIFCTYGMFFLQWCLFQWLLCSSLELAQPILFFIYSSITSGFCLWWVHDLEPFSLQSLFVVFLFTVPEVEANFCLFSHGKSYVVCGLVSSRCNSVFSACIHSWFRMRLPIMLPEKLGFTHSSCVCPFCSCWNLLLTASQPILILLVCYCGFPACSWVLSPCGSVFSACGLISPLVVFGGRAGSSGTGEKEWKGRVRWGKRRKKVGTGERGKREGEGGKVERGGGVEET